MGKGKKKSNKYFDSFFNDHIKIIMCLNYYFFLEFRPEGQAILRQKREKLQRFPRYKRSYIIRNGLKPNLQLIAGFRMSGKKMGNWVTKKEALGVKKGQKIKKEALNLQRVERKEEMWRKKKKKGEMKKLTKLWVPQVPFNYQSVI